MDKSAFINNVLSLASKFGIKLEDMHVSHGGSMLLLGLKNSTGLNPLSTGKSVQTLPLFFSFVKQRLIEAKYFKVCISKVAV